MNLYTADMHLCFEDILKTANRPFKSISEMNYAIINNINSRATKDDTLYIDGDVAFAGADVSYVVHLLKKIICKKVLIIGNHDRHLLKNKKFRACFKEIHEELHVTDGEYDIFLGHCPRAEWDGYYKGRYHFYAHVHGKKDGGAALIDLLPQAINVGVDVHNFFPVTAEEAINWRKATYAVPSDLEAFVNAVLHPEIDLSRSPKARKFAETNNI